LTRSCFYIKLKSKEIKKRFTLNRLILICNFHFGINLFILFQIQKIYFKTLCMNYTWIKSWLICLAGINLACEVATEFGTEFCLSNKDFVRDGGGEHGEHLLWLTSGCWLTGLPEPVDLLLLLNSLRWLLDPPNLADDDAMWCNRLSTGFNVSRSLNVFGRVWFDEVELVVDVGAARDGFEVTELPDSNLLRTRLTFPVQTGDGDRRRIDGGGAGETGLGLLVAFLKLFSFILYIMPNNWSKRLQQCRIMQIQIIKFALNSFKIC
jgi:hypothetical protein